MGQENVKFLRHMWEQSGPQVTEGDPGREEDKDS